MRCEACDYRLDQSLSAARVLVATGVHRYISAACASYWIKDTFRIRCDDGIVDHCRPATVRAKGATICISAGFRFPCRLNYLTPAPCSGNGPRPGRSTGRGVVELDVPQLSPLGGGIYYVDLLRICRAAGRCLRLSVAATRIASSGGTGTCDLSGNSGRNDRGGCYHCGRNRGNLYESAHKLTLP